MGLLTDALQTIRGHKIFANDVTVKGKLRLEGEITRIAAAGFKLDMSGTTTDWGTKKRIARYTVTGTLNASGTTTVNVAAALPVGTKAITLRLVMVDNTVGATCAISETGAAAGLWGTRTIVANVGNDANGDVQLTNGTFDVINSEALATVQLFITAVYL